MKNFYESHLKILRVSALVLWDLLTVASVSFIAVLIRFDFRLTEESLRYLEAVYQYLPYNLIITLIVFYFFRLYSSLWRFASIQEVHMVILGCGLSSFLTVTGMEVFIRHMPRSFMILYPILLISSVGGVRISYRFLRLSYIRRKNKQASEHLPCSKTMIIGAGEATRALIKEIRGNGMKEHLICCLIDDDPDKHDSYFYGYPIVGGREKIAESVERFRIDEIIICLPSATQRQTKALLEICKQTGCHIKLLPGIYQLVNGEVSVKKLRDVEIEDLLGRESIDVDLNEIMGYVSNQTVLVTGGGGSIGSELCRQIAGQNPKKLVVVDIYENNAYDLQNELKEKFPKLDLKVLIASVRNTNRIRNIMETYHPDIVYHAAAHKHVPLMEDSPNEAVKNNVFGTYKTAQAAAESGVKRFVMISTDKAVNPTNIMGASKRICEMIIQSFHTMYDTEFVAVRFGNVLGSNGSVIPLFRKQIAHGGPVTVTHPDIIRYFMTIREAVSLVLQAGAFAKGGEIFVLDMGEPVRIYDLAKDLIHLSGYRPDKDIEITFTGLRPGEKLYEEMLMQEENLTATKHKRIYIGQPIPIDKDQFFHQLERLNEASEHDSDEIREQVKEIVPSYQIPKKQEENGKHT